MVDYWRFGFYYNDLIKLTTPLFGSNTYFNLRHGLGGGDESVFYRSYHLYGKMSRSLGSLTNKGRALTYWKIDGCFSKRNDAEFFSCAPFPPVDARTDAGEVGERASMCTLNSFIKVTAATGKFKSG